MQPQLGLLPLPREAKDGNIDGVAELLRRGGDPNAISKSGASALLLGTSQPSKIDALSMQRLCEFV
eukprot:SAG11_NODE_1758_length_4306_cov_2.946993_6_plen_66_part_00